MDYFKIGVGRNGLYTTLEENKQMKGGLCNREPLSKTTRGDERTSHIIQNITQC